MLFASGDHRAAAELMLGALELAPDWSFGWFRLGEFHEAAGAAAEATGAWRMALRLDPADRVGAALKLRLAGAEAGAAAFPSSFAESLFDQYAKSFDESLVGRLGYRVPELLAAAIAAHAGQHRFGLVLDLGCGTGLMGERLRPLAARLEGFDISAEMLKRAAAKQIYDRLEKADLQAMAYDGPPADLVAAADVFMYLGPLERVAGLVRTMLASGGSFAFSVECHRGEADFELQPSRRYAHSPAYVRQVLHANALEALSLEAHIIRQDRGAPVEGLIVVAAG